ncbi:MIR domain containing protein [Trichuris trichiura]|uniref:MIR domain containing protein n=1 Tax=Trichuris trichiura TaxID=36087 RepID=A0A077Z2G7_TRITR|nr:MIR domain containing protein [Trichuris trichiura]
MTCWDQYLAILWTIFAVYQAAAGHTDAVTCTSVIKLINPKQSRRLHSHDVKYGSGSGQQSITGTSSVTDSNSYWIVLAPHKETCMRGEEIKCGSIIRLGHLNTKCLLHSHLFKSPLSGSQEVSCFGKNFIGDTGDNWMVICDGEVWSRKGVVSFQHVDTGKYFGASVTSHSEKVWQMQQVHDGMFFSFLGMTGNKYGRPINGQHEVCALSSLSEQCRWKTAEGVYFTKPKRYA